MIRIFDRINSYTCQNAVQETIVILHVPNVNNCVFLRNVIRGLDKRAAYQWPIRCKTNFKLIDGLEDPITSALIKCSDAVVEIRDQSTRVKIVDVGQHVCFRQEPGGRVDLALCRDPRESRLRSYVISNTPEHKIFK